MLRQPVQIAYAVDDVYAAASRWAARSAGPFFVMDHIEVKASRVWGAPQPFDHSSAFGQWGEVMVELICQHNGGARPLVGKASVHHVAFFVDSFAEATRELSERGFPEALYAETRDGMPFAFHDARAEYGHHLEIYERTAQLRAFYDLVRAAATDWDGSEPVRTL